MSGGEQRVLVVGPAWVGDMVMAHSLFQVLKRRSGRVSIDVVAPGWSAPLLERMPEVRESVALPLGHGDWGFGVRRKTGRELRERDYDQAIVLPRSYKSAFVPFFAKAKRRTGFLGELRWGLLNDIRRLDKQALPRTVDRFVALGLEREDALPGDFPLPRFTIDPISVKGARERLALPDTGAPVLGVCPGAAYGPAKQWPIHHFVELARRKAAEGWQVWIFGAGEEEEIGEKIREGAGEQGTNLAGRTSLGEALDLLSQATAVVSNDSGLMHVATALGRPVVALFGSSDPRHTPPLGDNATSLWLELECSPCFQRECPLKTLACLEEITPEMVDERLSEMV